MSDALNPRETLLPSPAEILARLPQMGRIMLIARSGGATHERLGTVDAVEVGDAQVRAKGASHDGAFDLAAIERVVVDRTGKMREKPLHRLECQTAAGETLCSVIALDGPELLEQVLARFGPGEAIEPAAESAFGEAGKTPEIPADDLGAATFAAIRETGESIRIEMRKPGFTQAWHGPLPEPKPAMGFVNLMQGDFHFHLKAGAVARWRRKEVADTVELHAEDGEGKGFGVVLIGSAAAFAGVPSVTPAA